MVRNKIVVKMGEGIIAKAPDIISSEGLGSCVAVILRDTQRKIGGFAHIMLPDSGSLNGYHPHFQFADSAIAHLLEEMQRMGASKGDVCAKMVGGAQMFSSYEDPSMGVGERNIVRIKEILRRNQIPVIGEDVGGRHGRSVEVSLESGTVIVKAIKREDKKI